MKSNFPLITVLGPTAVGKTNFAVTLASLIATEIISADSRQVYQGMDIGTGKDLDEYSHDGISVSYHLIDIAQPGEEYNLFRFTNDFWNIYSKLRSKKVVPVLCGGTGMYIDALLRHNEYNLIEVPENNELREVLTSKSNQELTNQLSSLRKLHNTTDTVDRLRLIRAIEIELYKQNDKKKLSNPSLYPSPVFGLSFNRETIRRRITERLDFRLRNGMIEEVKNLLALGLKAEQLVFYGLEYKYVTNYLQGELSYNRMFELLNIAIHQFAKRQMTYFRRMEKNGIYILWLEGEDGLDLNCNKAMEYLQRFKSSNE